MEILFRGKTTSKGGKHEFNNVWVEGDLIVSDGRYYIHPRSNRVRVEGELGKLIVMHEVVPETVGQHTGLKDVTGKMIFTGDIVEVWKNGELQMRGVVVWGHGSFEIKDPNYSDGYCMCLAWSEAMDMKVIGNVYDNPELLK